jgi:signal transduction histidine kinase
MSRWRSRRTYIPFIAVIGIFTASLGFSLYNTLRQEALGQLELTHLLWAATQLEIEHYRFLDSLNHYALEGVDPDKRDLTKRFDMLWSRPDILMTGEGGTRFRMVEGAEDLVTRYQQTLRDIEPLIGSIEPGDRDAYRALHDRLNVFSLPLHNVVRNTFHATDQATVFRNRELGDAYLLLVISLVGVLFSGAVLVVFLIRQVRKATLAEVAALEARQLAEAASRAMGDFLANMSHELRTPLNAIIGFAEVIRCRTFGSVGNSRYEEYIDDIHASGNHLLGVIGDILDMAKIEARKLELDEEPLDIGETVDAVVRLVGPHAAEAKLTLQAGVPLDFPHFHGDKRLVRQMILNLLANAIKFTPPGGTVTVDAMLESDGRPLIRIRDTGIGMAAHEIEEALSPYGQANPKTREAHRGTGLGLPLVKAFAELHGGTLKVQSAPGRGTLVLIRFPAARAVTSAAA